MKNKKISLGVERVLGAFKYLIAALMLFEGVETAIGPLRPQGGDLGFIYSNRVSLVCFGVYFFSCGAALLYGKLKKSRRWTGRGLLMTFIAFLFAGILNTMADDRLSAENLIAAVVLGGLWLRWRIKTSYIDPDHFVDSSGQLR
jgi:hypothetical protein